MLDEIDAAKYSITDKAERVSFVEAIRQMAELKKASEAEGGDLNFRQGKKGQVIFYKWYFGTKPPPDAK